MRNLDKSVAVAESSENAVKVEIKGTMVERPNKSIVVKSAIRAGGSVNPWRV